VEPVELLDDGSAVADVVSKAVTELECELSELETEVIEKMMANLPA